jgi:hypothetical protein
MKGRHTRAGLPHGRLHAALVLFASGDAERTRHQLAGHSGRRSSYGCCTHRVDLSDHPGHDDVSPPLAEAIRMPRPTAAVHHRRGSGKTQVIS